MNYEIIYSKRRTVALSVKDARLIVRAPFGTKSSVIEKMIRSHEKWITSHIEKQMTRVSEEISLTESDIARYKKTARSVLCAKAEYYSKLMGLQYGRITITSAKTRYGSCSSSGNISFSWRLMLKPDAAIDYVVVHELAHLVEMNHSKRFYAVVEKVLPDYKERKMLLK